MGTNRPNYTELLNTQQRETPKFLFQKPLERNGYYLVALDTWEQLDRQHSRNLEYILTQNLGYMVLPHPNGMMIKTPDEIKIPTFPADRVQKY